MHIITKILHKQSSILYFIYLYILFTLKSAKESAVSSLVICVLQMLLQRIVSSTGRKLTMGNTNSTLSLRHPPKDPRIKSDRVINYSYLRTRHAFVGDFVSFPFSQPFVAVFLFQPTTTILVGEPTPSLHPVSTFSSTPEASVVRRPRKMVARSGTSLIFHFVAYRYRGAAPRRRAPGHRYSLQASIQGGRKGGGRERAREKKERQI